MSSQLHTKYTKISTYCWTTINNNNKILEPTIKDTLHLMKKKPQWDSRRGTITIKSFPTPQFKSINSLVLNFLYSPALTQLGLCAYLPTHHKSGDFLAVTGQTQSCDPPETRNAWHKITGRGRSDEQACRRMKVSGWPNNPLHPTRFQWR